MQPIKTYKKGNKELRIFRDVDPQSNPREWDNLGIMMCFHKRYNLPNETDENQDGFYSWGEVENFILKEIKPIAIFPIYLYDHSGISISINRNAPFNCPFDSGQIGYIFMTKETAKKNKLTKNKAEKILIDETEVYNQFLEGDVYGFELYKKTKCKFCVETKEENIDGCWGFYGSDFDKNGLFDHAGIKDISKWDEKDG